VREKTKVVVEDWREGHRPHVTNPGNRCSLWRMRNLRLWALALLTIYSGPLIAFNGHLASEGPLTLAIGGIGPVSALNQPYAVSVALTNSGTDSLTVNLKAKVIDECRLTGKAEMQVNIPAQGEVSTNFTLVMVPGSHSALYPFHVTGTFTFEGKARAAHAIRIFESKFPERSTAQPGELPFSTIPSHGGIALGSIKTYGVSWQWIGKPLEHLPIGWAGSEGKSLANLGFGRIDRGATRQSLIMHPPYQGGLGSLFVEYRLKLPPAQPIKLIFYNAIRDNSPQEPPSDGVTFRVWAGDQRLFERHTASKSWVPGEADLTGFAGKEILLRLEVHPGPQLNTVCDSGFWGDLVVFAGEPPRSLTSEEKEKLREVARTAVRTGAADGKNAFLFELGEGNRAAVGLGPNGIVDGVIAFGTAGGSVVFDGMRISVLDQTLGSLPAGLQVEQVVVSGNPTHGILVLHSLRITDPAGKEKSVPLKAELRRDGAGLRIKIASPERITDLALAKADQKATRVFYGHGYCIVDPGSFRAGGGGHNLSTSHVACEFENGISLLTACDTAPDDFEVDGPGRIYALHSHPDSTFTFVPGSKGAFDCAIRYRPLYDKQRAPAVDRKTGRFVFDIWGGRYAEDARALRRCFDYGLTNSLALMHVWQRWGYDYRLPDIFPPSPDLGTLEDLRDLGETCRRAGALWGLHDNYVDFYPDATGFSYEHVAFSQSGEPRKGWLNEWRDAQAYQFRPDHVGPFLERNLNLIKPALEPSASFVDVWTSMNVFDYWDCQGNFHSKTETLRCWGEAFRRLRDTLDHGPTTSEAGSDQLIGWLDGADCQFLRLASSWGRFVNRAPCADWERIPWFDLVNHTRFSLHGVGYSDRYQGGLSREEHGIESDDYISTEMLTGHALMIDLPGMGRGAVRKYWLAQKFIESIARDEISNVEFAGGDVHRLAVSWKAGGRVYVNRGSNDWEVAGAMLPPFGYCAKNGRVESSVQRISGRVVEQSRSPNEFYVNGRGYDPNARLAIRPEGRKTEYLGGRRFRLIVDWEALEPAPADLTVFYHFSREVPGLYMNSEFYGGGRPEIRTSRWSGRITTGTNWVVEVPEKIPPGEYDVLVGLFNAPGNGKRFRLIGDEDSQRRYRLGKIFIEGGGPGAITGIRFEPSPLARTFPVAAGVTSKATDFGLAQTKGAFKVSVEPQGLIVMPLPDGEDFEVTLNLRQIVSRDVSVHSLYAVNVKGERQQDCPFTKGPGTVAFTVRKDTFEYRLTLE
jgi:hypothetical protein